LTSGEGRGRIVRALDVSGSFGEGFANRLGSALDAILISRTSAVEEKVHGRLVAQQVDGIVEVFEVIEQVDLAIDVCVRRKVGSVGLEDQLADIVPAIFSQMRGTKELAEYITSYWSISVSGITNLFSRPRGRSDWEGKRSLEILPDIWEYNGSILLRRGRVGPWFESCSVFVTGCRPRYYRSG
jgi:hypothetical protein